jgi:hypothetical protein
MDAAMTIIFFITLQIKTITVPRFVNALLIKH